MHNVIVIFGPTASGKTRLSIELAKEIGGEIISADSMQIYKFMDIGTAKPSKEEMDGIKHYMIDEVYPDEEFSVAKYKKLALEYIKEIISKGKIPIIIGGTGLYINSLIYNIDFSEVETDWDLRNKLKKEADEKGNAYLHDKLKAIDPDAAQKIHVNDVKRIIRAIEVYESTGKTISHLQKVSRLKPPEYNYIKIGLTMDRAKLYDRINKRVDVMLENGLVDEVKKLVELGYDKNAIAMQGLGYKEILAYLRGECTLAEAVEILKRETRRYAKRQITWFKRIKDVFWIDMDKFNNEHEIIENLKDCLATSGIFL
ncbi:MAG TPA: tRNA (adenosine(37)-N6)-dimethylallyltransferase MiaA [Clostridiaceae bacterium]|nr:tRNA (adenosine(37)-N6)-dimethylallyltransferase MiaA [Clostridiaceae bacterium]